DFIIIGDDCSAFASGHQLACLEAECSGNSERADATSAPFAAVRVGAVFNQGNTFSLGKFAKAIEVSRMPAQMHGYDGLRTSSDRGLNEVGIDAIRLGQDVHHDGHSTCK